MHFDVFHPSMRDKILRELDTAKVDTVDHSTRRSFNSL